jgi:hypothetical protein
MEHPLIGNIDHLSTDELSSKITDLNRKLNVATNTGNAHLCDQIRMALTTFQNKYQERLRAENEQQLRNANIDTTKIDIR